MFDLRNCGVSRIICVYATRWGPLLVLRVGVDWPWSTVTTMLYPPLLWTRIIYSGRARHFPRRCNINKVAKQPKETYQRQFNSDQFKMVSMRSTPSLRSLPNVAFETLPMLVWLTMTVSRPLKEEHWKCCWASRRLSAVTQTRDLKFFLLQVL